MCLKHRKAPFLVHGVLALLTATLSGSRAAAQTSWRASSQPSRELPNEVHAALEQTEDFSFNFAQPGFYALLEYLKTTNNPPGHARGPVALSDWTMLLERPADFRGLPVTVEGFVGRNKAWRFEQEEYRHLGTVWQLELWRPDQPIACTLVLTGDASDIPLGATIRVTGYFVMIRQYPSQTRQARQSALLVAHGPTLVSQSAARTRTGSTSNWIVGLVAAATAALIVIWILLRRSIPRTQGATPALRASGPAPVSLADDLAAWVAEESQRPPRDSADAKAAEASNQTGDADDVNDADRP
ncbi:MAG: hypothetical protein ACE5I3_08440 [Phycisphaerae bacterium]